MSIHTCRLLSAAAVLSLTTAPAMAQTSTMPPAPATAQQPAAQTAPAVPSSQTAQPDTAAQTPPASTGSPAPSATAGSNANATVSQSAPLTAGMTVKDKNGTAIGQVAKLDKDSQTGQQMATIKMGKDSFRLQADRLAVADGAATVNLTQDEIQTQLHPKK